MKIQHEENYGNLKRIVTWYAIDLKYSNTAFDAQPPMAIICGSERPAFIAAVAPPMRKL
ncbi:44463_t:CDS:2 [Gigaspora margarita]|uniref:44463_t:CDS:1 n=1 Tax=Gigaspora margarita TaxID=4874 RepID=A0ABN7UJ80_GIGMA|nr:44463_t:CDS:2 [Gigaspora margarita]